MDNFVLSGGHGNGVAFFVGIYFGNSGFNKLCFTFLDKFPEDFIIFSGAILIIAKMSYMIVDCLVYSKYWRINLFVYITPIFPSKVSNKTEVSIVAIPLYLTDVVIIQKEVNFFF